MLRSSNHTLLSPYVPHLDIYRHKKNVETFDQVKKLVLEVRKFFGDQSPEIPEEDVTKIFFSTLTDFALQYAKALKDLDDWEEQVWSAS